MPPAPRENGSAGTFRQSFAGSARAAPTSFQVRQSKSWITDATTAGYEASAVDHESCNSGPYQGPSIGSSEQSYVVQGGGPFAREGFTNNTITAGEIASNGSLATFNNQLGNQSGYYFNIADSFEQEDTLVNDPPDTQRSIEELARNQSYSEQQRHTRNSTGPISAGPPPPPIQSAAVKTSQRPSSTLLRTAYKRNFGALPSSAVQDRSGHSTGFVRDPAQSQQHERMPNPTSLPGTSAYQTDDNAPEDRLVGETPDSIASDVANASDDNAEVDGSGGPMSPEAAPLEEPDVGAGQPPGILQTGVTQQASSAVLPAEKVFPIQIGSELFRLSGASIASDAPSYFSQFFENQLRQRKDDAVGVRTLYIDRDPVTFQDISRHLQGYHVQPRDGSHFVRLFADAQFYSLPRLISQLFDSEIFIQIGHQHFQVPRDIFSGPGDSPNFFSLGFAVFFSTPAEVFPGLDRKSLLRPPSILPPSVPNRSAQVFSELLHMLRGYPLRIRDEQHRAELLRDCRYFHLRGLEQKLIAHDISFNLERGRSEIVIRLEDIRQSGISFVADASPADRSPSSGWVHYSRPFVDEDSHELILEVGSDATKIDFRTMRADFRGLAKARISSLFQVVANKMNLPTNVPLGLMMMAGGGAATQSASPGNTPLSEDQVKIRIERDAHVILDGDQHEVGWIGLGAGNETDDGDPPQSGSRISSDYEPKAFPAADIGSASRRMTEDSLLRRPKPQHVAQQISRTSNNRSPPPRKRRRLGSLDDFGEWIIRRGQWRLKVQASTDPARSDLEMVLIAVKLDAISGERGRNTQRGFLT